MSQNYQRSSRGRRPDKYRSFDALNRGEHKNAFRIKCLVRARKVAVIAPHGGKIESWTSEIATSIAAQDYCLYCFEGIKQRDNWDLHITSTRFDEPQCLSLLSLCDRVVTVHGCDSDALIAYMGGLDRILRNSIREHLNAAGFVTDVHHDRPDLQGLNKHNICNRGRLGMGVQLELSYGLRTALIKASPAMGAFTEAIRRSIRAVAD
jgi:phage replication-related protein YjqB (UPF0714/DUF867 family)